MKTLKEIKDAAESECIRITDADMAEKALWTVLGLPGAALGCEKAIEDYTSRLTFREVMLDDLEHLAGFNAEKKGFLQIIQKSMPLCDVNTDKGISILKDFASLAEGFVPGLFGGGK